MDFFAPIVEDRIVAVDEPFIITLQEQTFLYLAWEPTIPEHIELIDKKREFKELVEILTLTFVSHTPGNSTLLFTYKKQCCDHRVVTTQSYNITTTEPVPPVDSNLAQV